MIISTVIEILLAILAVYGLYTLSRQLAFFLFFDKNIRHSVKVAAEIFEDDSEDAVELKKLLAKKIALDSFVIREYTVIDKKKEHSNNV